MVAVVPVKRLNRAGHKQGLCVGHGVGAVVMEDLESVATTYGETRKRLPSERAP
jgi:hypothetical protein